MSVGCGTLKRGKTAKPVPAALGRAYLGMSYLAMVFLMLLPQPVLAQTVPEELVPMGDPVGIELNTEGVTVVGLSGVPADSGNPGPAERAGIAAGDIITGIGGETVTDARDFLTALARLDGSPVEVDVLRSGRQLRITLTPEKGTGGEWQFGLWLRDGISGIGTMTWYDPASGVYGALGHGVSDLTTGALASPSGGEILASDILDVSPGGSGAPGELCGRADPDDVLGNILKNTDAGIFGQLFSPAEGTPTPVAPESEIRLGPASILCSVSGREIRSYDVEITRLYHDPEDTRCMMLTVTDPALLSATGGIVQGMSGSPVLQDGRLIGAVTHVLVSDPTRGYGVSVERMVKAALETEAAAA